LIKDLCSRLPYNCIVSIAEGGIDGIQWTAATLNSYLLHQIMEEDAWEYIKPYLRPMSSMTDEEKEELKALCDEDLSEFAGHIMKGHGLSRDGLYMFDKLRQLDWLNRHHFDFRGLIDKGLAIEIDNETYEKIYGKII
jgi:hypothetical protein